MPVPRLDILNSLYSSERRNNNKKKSVQGCNSSQNQFRQIIL